MAIRLARIGVRVAIVLISLAAAARGGSALAAPPDNLDFERGDPGQAPAGWFIPTGGTTATLTDVKPNQGRLCVELVRDPASPAPFSNLMRTIDAADYRGKRIEVTASVRCETAVNQRVQMWVRADLSNGEMGLFDNMSDRPVRVTEWTPCTIRGEVEENADHLCVGFMLFGSGRAWIDGVSIKVLGNAGEGFIPPSPLTEQGLANVRALARLIGVVRHFHPTTENQDLKWDDYTIRAVQDVETAKDRAQLVEKLAAWMAPIAPSIQVWAGDVNHGPAAPAAPADAEYIIGCKHIGYSEKSDEPNIYSTARVRETLKESDRQIPGPGAAVVLDLGDGVSARVPVSVYADANATLPRATAKPPATPARADDWAPSAKDRATRLAAVIEAWNVIRHFYPYFDVVECDWSAALPVALSKAATDATPDDFWITLASMQAKMKDGHGYLSGPGMPDTAPRPFAWTWVGQALVIHSVAEDFNGLLAGDVVQEIDGHGVDELYAEAAQTICAATEQWRRARALGAIGWKAGKGSVTLTVKRGDRVLAVEVPRFWSGKQPRIDKPETGSEVAPGIVYFDLNGAEAVQLSKTMATLVAAKGVIFDLRGYPGSAGFSLFPHLTHDKTVTSARWMIPTIILPDYENVTFTRDNWIVPPASPTIAGPIAFLTGGGAVSYAESCMGIVEYYKLAEIVGSPTAGTNGNITTATLPGGYAFTFTGMQVLKQDGSTHHGVGIQPTVPVQPTIAGIAAGKDEVLDKAVQVLRAKIERGGAAAPEQTPATAEPAEKK